MLSLLNFRNYDLDYVVEYPILIEQFEMTAETHLNFTGWFFQNDFESFYNVLSTVFNSVYDISLAIEKTFNPNHYANDRSILAATDGEKSNRYAEVSKCLNEGFGFLKSNCESGEAYAQLESEMHDSLFFLRSVLNELSSVIISLQKRDTKTALLLLRSLFSLDLRSYFCKRRISLNLASWLIVTVIRNPIYHHFLVFYLNRVLMSIYFRLMVLDLIGIRTSIKLNLILDLTGREIKVKEKKMKDGS